MLMYDNIGNMYKLKFQDPIVYQNDGCISTRKHGKHTVGCMNNMN